MTLTSNFNLNDNVWFYTNTGKIVAFQGTIDEILSWDLYNGFRYKLKHINDDGYYEEYTSEEKNMYKTKEELLATIFSDNKLKEEEIINEE